MRRCMAALLAAWMLFLYGCAPAQPPADEASAAAPPQSRPAAADTAREDAIPYTLQSRSVYYPEGSDGESAVFALHYALPVFTGDAAEKANEALALWEKELFARAAEDWLPYADRTEGEEAPCAKVDAQVYTAGGCTNIRFSEELRFGGESEWRSSAIVLDGEGEVTNLYAISGLYAPEALLAQQVYNRIDGADPGRENFYGDLTPADIELALDLHNGFCLTDTGYVLLFQRGVLADAAQGLFEIDVPFVSLYPDFVGEAIAPEDYAALWPMLGLLARACAAENHSFEGEPDAFIATLFLGLCFADRPVERGYRRVAQAEYEALAEACFASWPANISAGDGTVLEDGFYNIPAIDVAAYGLRLDGCTAERDALQLRGMLFYGAPGSADWGELTPVTIQLERSDRAAAGYLFTGFAYA